MDYQLMNKLKNAIPPVEEIEKHYAIIEANSKKINSLQMESGHYETPGKAGIVISVVIANFIFTPIWAMISNLAKNFIVTLILALVFLFGGGFIIWKLIVSQIIKKSNKKKIAENNAIILRLQQQIDAEQEINNQIYLKHQEILDELPPDYLYSFALTSLYNILRNQRADSLKEALSVFNDDIHKQVMRDGQSEILRRQAALESEINYVAELAIQARDEASRCCRY